MRPSFHPRLINGPFGDPGLYISFLFEKRALLFDLGDITNLSPKDILKISHVFITHTHMDHFIGFDMLIRLFLGREKTLYLYGPAPFLRHVEGKLAGYSWDLVNNYKNPLVLHAVEIGPQSITTCEYRCEEGFRPGEVNEHPFDTVLLAENGFSISMEIFDHSIPCLGFSFKERFHVNIRKDALSSLGLEIGPWLKRFKSMLLEGKDPASIIEVDRKGRTDKYRLGELADRIALVTPGQKITYISDICFNPKNEKKAIMLAGDSDQLFIEAAFLKKDSEIAMKKHHLTAHQAGYIAGMANAKQYFLFHFSPRYTGLDQYIMDEASNACSEAMSRDRR
ncbi:MAG: ribonuclease Z [Deltaproteobacteria bacterium RBG_13_49_15]|nr:MAG: ribonuclease Z [Deltaproteobacteria bacterium RBG_13_49_15]